MPRTHAVRRTLGILGPAVDAVWRRPGVAALIYHRVGGRTASPVDFPTADFLRQLDWLAENARVITLDDALTPEPPGDRRPRVVLTFDDGTADWPDVVMPALAARGMAATFYVATRYVEEARPFPDDGAPVSWQGLAEMASTGLATMGSHTHSHRVLAGVTSEDARHEADRSIALMSDRLGLHVRHFAYPKAVAPSPAAEVVVRRRFATAALAGNRTIRPDSDRHRLGRHALTRADDLECFARKVAGGMVLEGWLREVRDAIAASAAARSRATVNPAATS